MPSASSQATLVGDRRVLRTRTALFAAAVRLVSARGSTSIPVTELADAAGVSRQVVYLQFGDRESLLVAAAMDLWERELYPLFPDLRQDTMRTRMLSAADHLAEYHRFYRALITGSCAFALRAAATQSFRSLHSKAAIPVFDDIPAQHLAVAGTFLVGGVMAVIDDWLLTASEEKPDPLVLTDHLLSTANSFTSLDLR